MTSCQKLCYLNIFFQKNFETSIFRKLLIVAHLATFFFSLKNLSNIPIKLKEPRNNILPLLALQTRIKIRVIYINNFFKFRHIKYYLRRDFLKSNKIIHDLVHLRTYDKLYLHKSTMYLEKLKNFVANN